MSKPRTFQELAAKVHDMEMTIANHRSKPSSSYEFKKDKGEIKKNLKPAKEPAKESMATSIEEPVKIAGKCRPKENKGASLRDVGRKRPTLKELQVKKYPFPDADLSGMLDDLLENRIIGLPEPTRPEEAEGQATRSTVAITGLLAIL